MYVIGIVEVEETVSFLSREEPTVSFSMEEFVRYVDLFKEMMEEAGNSEYQGNQDELDLSIVINEFDLAEI